MLDDLAALTRDAVAETRRVMLALTSGALDETDLPQALHVIARRIAHGTGVRVAVRTRGEVRSLPPEVSAALLRVGQEALGNALRHARASRVHLELTYRPASVGVAVRDDGRGFDPAHPTGGLGLAGMRDRVREAGGRFQLVSTLGHGTRLSATLSLPADPGEGTRPPSACWWWTTTRSCAGA